MHITVYIQNKPLYLCNELDAALKGLHHKPETIFIDEPGAHSINAMLEELSLPEIQAGILVQEDLEALKESFFKRFKIHVAGGGLVLNDKREILFIYRRGYWDLPKGHQDEGERIEACAIREVREETGLQNLKIIRALQTTYHVYEQGTKHILKESHWFLMQAQSEEPLVPQTEEDIQDIRWVLPKDAGLLLQAAYPSIQEVVNGFLKPGI